MNKKVTVSVIIPAYNAERTLPGLLQSLMPIDPKTTEVIVVNDASTDTTLRVAKQVAGVRILTQQPTNKGVAAARNRGGNAARNMILLFLDADVRCFPDTLQEVIRTYQKRPKLDACSGIIVLPPQNTPFFPRYKGIRTYVYWMFENRGAWNTQPFGNACGSVWRAVFQKVGGFDERFLGASLEDAEFGARLVSHGYSVGFNSKIRIRHRFEDFLPMIAKYIHRSRVWTRMFLSRRSFESVGMTKGESVNGMIAAGVLPLVGIGFIITNVYFFALTALLMHLYLAQRFYRFVYREAGFMFMVGTIGLQLFLYTVIYTASAVSGLEVLAERFGLKRTPTRW